MFALAASATTARAAMATPPRVAAAPRARSAAIVPAPVRSRRHGIAHRGASRRVVRVDALPFGFGKKDPAEEEPEEEEPEEAQAPPLRLSSPLPTLPDLAAA